MTITESTRRQLFDKTNHSVIRVQQKRHAPLNASTPSLAMGTWTVKEHELFLEGLSLYPSGPWKRVAQHIGSRTPRQVMTHAQKYRQRLQRRAALAVKQDETSRPIPKTLHSDRVLSVVVSPMQIPMQMAIPGAPSGSTGEIHVEAAVCVLPVSVGDRPAVFRGDPPPYGHSPVFGLDELFAHLATDHMFDSVDMSLPYADVEPLQF